MFISRIVPQRYRERFRPVIERYRAKLKGQVTGRSLPRLIDYSLRVPFASGFAVDRETPETSKPIAVVCHLYDHDLAGEIHAQIANIPVAADLFISTDTEEKAASLQGEFSSWKQGRVDIRVVEDRGRDIAPKYITFRDVYDRYDLILFVHSKKTKHPALGEAWRKHLIHTLTGSRDIVSSILWMFAHDDRLGVVFPQHFIQIRPLVRWCGEYPQAKLVAQRMGVALRPNQLIDFPSGSMFWVRSAALLPILNLNLKLEDFPEEEGQTGDTLIHVLERLLLHACEQAGCHWLKISSEGFEDAPETVVNAKQPSDYDDFIAKHTFRILSR
jgi:O-antigen biosynthesis protein